MIRSTLGIRGNVTIIKRKYFRGMDLLERLWLEEIESGKKLLTPFQNLLLKKAEVERRTVHNLTMTRAVDRMVCLVGRCPGWQLDTLDDDRAKIANMLHGFADWTVGAPPLVTELAWESPLMFPEVIGIGSGRAAPTIDDTSLEQDFNSYVSAPDAVTYRNTYNSKEGGILKANATVSGDDYESDYIAKYANIYGSGEVNFIQQPIWELGLFAPKIQMGITQVENGNLITYNNLTAPGAIAPTPNTIWSMLNLSVGEDPMTIINTVQRNDLAVSRAGQTVTLGGFCVAAPVPPDNVAIPAFTPRWDSLLSAGAWGNTNSFSPGPLLARVVLPVSFIKNINFSLTVLWQIYFERL